MQLFPIMVNEKDVFDIHAIYNCGDSNWCYQVFERSLDQTTGQLPVKRGTEVTSFPGGITSTSGLQEDHMLYVVHDRENGQKHVETINLSEH